MKSDEEKLLKEIKKMTGYEWELVTRNRKLFEKLKPRVRPELEETIEELQEISDIRMNLLEGQMEMFEDLLDE